MTEITPHVRYCIAEPGRTAVAGAGAIAETLGTRYSHEGAQIARINLHCRCSVQDFADYLLLSTRQDIRRTSGMCHHAFHGMGRSIIYEGRRG
jgi:hypothetical protein